MTLPTRRHLLGCLALAPLAACASDEPDYYRLAAVPGTPLPAPPRRIELRQAGLPRYLDRREIVRAGPSLRMEIREGERWAEPIADMVTRVLAENLAQRLPGATVFPEGSATARDPDTAAEADITRFEADAAGRVAISGRFSVRRLGTGRSAVEGRVEETVAMDGTGTDALARAMSTALGLFADRMAAAVR
jgi:uncharacterized protein